MKQPIIHIERASEELILSLIQAEILEVREDGVHVKEPQSGNS